MEGQYFYMLYVEGGWGAGQIVNLVLGGTWTPITMESHKWLVMNSGGEWTPQWWRYRVSNEWVGIGSAQTPTMGVWRNK